MTKAALKFTLAIAAFLPTTALADWTGFYGGLSYGSVSDSEFKVTSGIGAQADLSDTEGLGGFLGYQAQNGNVVWGAELELFKLEDMTGSFSGVNVALDTVSVDLKSRVGYAFGDVLAYGVLGVSAYSIENDLFVDDFDQSGISFGAGAEYLITDNFFMGVEYLSRRPSETVEFIGTNLQLETESTVNSIAVRAGFKF